MDLDGYKQQAAEKAIEQVESGAIVGLGTGSTAGHAIHMLGALLASGRLQDIIAIPTSETTARQAEAHGIPLATLDDYPIIDLTIDGADEIDPQLQLIKGLGGALLREKIVALASKRLVIIADYSKRVEILGSKAPVPVEVIPFARRPVTAYLQSLGARVVERRREGKRFLTDEGNNILDCHFDAISDPTTLAHTLHARSGIVEHGLFLGLASQAVVAGPDGVDVLSPI